MDAERYALYYAPPEGSALARFGAGWLGWDAGRGAPAPHPEIGLDVAAITATPRKYGFHGTLKPPFRLAGGAEAAALDRAARALAGRIAPFEAPPLRLARLGRFLALIPSGDSPALAALAAACVQELDAFRAPASEAELAKRRAKGLTARQDATLTRWGYPYLLEEFRFHLTLTGPLDDTGPVERALAPLTAPFCADPMPVREICLFGEGGDGHFRILRRYALTG